MDSCHSRPSLRLASLFTSQLSSFKHMAKMKVSKKAAKPNAPNSALHSRVSYLFQAARYLASHNQSNCSEVTEPKYTDQNSEPSGSYQLYVRSLVSDLRDVSEKVLIRMSPEMKRSICKNCDTILIERSTCLVQLENKSKGGKKPWADVLVRKCNTCGSAKRYPLAPKQKRRPVRSRVS